MIEVRSLTKNFGKLRAVDAVSFSVEQGNTLALVGTSGSGKTTTLKMLNRLVEPSSGEILINGENIMQQSIIALRRNMGYVIQNSGLFPHYTVAENIGLLPALLGWSAEKRRQRASDLLQRLGMDSAIYLDKYPQQLSGGQQQRVGIARALAADPPIILMDEPFGALDPITRQSVRREFKELDELSRKTSILVTHDIEEAFEMADQVCLLDEGRVQQLGTPRDLLFDPANTFVQQFLGEKRFQLELQTLQLRHMIADLPPLKDSASATIQFAPRTTIQVALDRLVSQESKRKLASVEWEGQQRQFNLETLMSSLQKTLNQ